MILSGRIARPKLVATFVLTSVLTGTAGYLVGITSTTDQEAALASAQETIDVYAPAEKRVLGEYATFNGTINKPEPHKFNYTGTGTITTVNLQPGDTLVPGTVVATVDSNPVITTFGSDKPIYRDLNPGDTGYDVEAVQEILNKLGYPLRVTGTFDEATEKAAQRLYSTIGFTSPCGEKTCFLTGTFLTIPASGLTVVSVAQPGTNTAEDPQLFATQESNKTVKARIGVAQRGIFDDKPSITVEGSSGYIIETDTYTLSDFKESQGDDLPGYDLVIELPEDIPNLPDDKTPVRLSLSSQSAEYLAVPAVAIRQEGTQTYVLLEDGSRVDVTVKIIQQGWAGIAEVPEVTEGTKVLVS